MESQHFLEDCPVHIKEKNIIMNLNARDTQLPRNNERKSLNWYIFFNIIFSYVYFISRESCIMSQFLD